MGTEAEGRAVRVKKLGNITHSIAFKVFLFILLAASFLVCAGSVVMALRLGISAYDGNFEAYMYDELRPVARDHLTYICFEKAVYSTLEEMKEAFQKESEANGIGYTVKRDGRLVWRSAAVDEDTPFVYQYTMDNRFEGENKEHTYIFSLYVDDSFPKEDAFQGKFNLARTLYDLRFTLIWLAALGGLLSILFFIWLMCNAGHRMGQEGISPSVLTPVPIELLAIVFGIPAFVVLAWYYYQMGWNIVSLALGILVCSFEAVWCTIFCRELALRIKMGNWWRNSLIYRGCRLIWRLLQVFFREAPSIFHVVILVIFFFGYEFWGLQYRRSNQRVIWFLVEKLVVLPLIFYCALAFKKLQKGSKRLAEGDFAQKLDTKYLALDFKKHGENLNRIGEGIAKAVEQRMRSERLKTELITNVSHDLKTPLTSVINYADLLGSEAAGEGGAPDQEKMAEYAEVLLRQSNRLKKLLDDLLEASKAATGNMEVNMTPCELGVLLTQATGEYEARFAEKNLILHMGRPEEEIQILADGRHLWRVFDNLLNNIYKYAQEGSRVYLNMEREEDRVKVIFRNMSKYELNVSAQELEERFVRGDKSRHMEGNGLGLSIAKGLVELQNGKMQIVTDGDLFKVTLEFGLIKE